MIDTGSAANEFPVSFWNWRTAVAVIRDLDIVDEYTVRRMSETASGLKVEKALAKEIGRRLRSEILPKLAPNKRIFENLTITDVRDDGVLHGSEDEPWRNFSADHDWFEDFADFCDGCSGFEIY